jgi:hypothetical protein
MILFVDFGALLCALGERSTTSYEFLVVVTRVAQIVNTEIEQITLVLEGRLTGRNIDQIGLVVENADVRVDELGLPNVYLLEGC